MQGHQRFYWWSLPTGLCRQRRLVGGAVLVFSLIAWGLRLAIVKWGGMPLYEKAKSLFLGLILGEAVAMGMWLVVDGWLGEMGNFLSYI